MRSERDRNVTAAYDDVAEIYARLYVDDLDDRPTDHARVRALAHDVRRGTGPILDIGCGPGHVTAELVALGADAVGIEPSGSMLAEATRRFPGCPFVLGDMTALPCATGRAGGVLARYSTIHTPPTELQPAFSEFARVLRRGGSVLLFFHAADPSEPHGESFDHRVATAYRADPDRIAEALTREGFTIDDVARRPPAEGERFTQACVTARRSAG
ncbi:MAG: class I SAM-dependent methyltransferase [Acidimicrobiales bacterium]|nr:class I SAM-dependent methyltransferase [Acidimicrobiales bacterium]